LIYSTVRKRPQKPGLISHTPALSPYVFRTAINLTYSCLEIITDIGEPVIFQRDVMAIEVIAHQTPKEEAL
jgi:hypothetical protein